MNRMIALLLALVLCLSLAACGGKTAPAADTPDSGKEETQTDESGSTEAEAQPPESTGAEYPRNADGFVELTMEQFADFCRIETLTPENWEQYFVMDQEHQLLVQNTRPLICKGGSLQFVHVGVLDTNNVSSEIKYESADDPLTLGVLYGALDGRESVLYLRLQDSMTGKDFDLSEAECIGASGTMLVNDIPDDLWTYDADGVGHIVVEGIGDLGNGVYWERWNILYAGGELRGDVFSEYIENYFIG